jgi:HSP20 family protein
MTSPKNETLKDLTDLQERMKRILSESAKRVGDALKPDVARPWAPAVDIFELEDSFVILVEVPGIPRQAVSVEVKGQTLTIRGERPVVDNLSPGSLYRSERHYGAFERAFNLPGNIRSDNIEARLNEGVLAITIGKVNEEEARVKVTIG